MKFNLCFFMTYILTSKDRLFDKLLTEVKTEISPDKLMVELKKADVSGLQDPEEAFLILASMMFCKAIYKKSAITYDQVRTFVTDSQTAWKLVVIADKLINLDVSEFLQQSIAKRCKLPKVDAAYMSKMNTFKLEISKCRFNLGTDFPVESERVVETKQFERIKIEGAESLKMFTVFRTSKNTNFRYTLPFDPQLKTFFIDILFVVPKDTIISEVDSNSDISQDKFVLQKDANARIIDLDLSKCKIEPKERGHLRLVRANQKNQKLAFRRYSTKHPVSCVENGIQVIPKFETIFEMRGNRYNNKDLLCLPGLSNDHATFAIENFVNGQVFEKFEEGTFLEFDKSTVSNDDISNGWAIISVDMADNQYTSFLFGYSDTLTQGLTISNVGTKTFFLEKKTNFDVVKYDPRAPERKDYFEYTKIDPIEDSSDSTPVQPTPPSSPAQTSTVMIIVSCLIGLAVLLGIGYYLYTKKNNNN